MNKQIAEKLGWKDTCPEGTYHIWLLPDGSKCSYMTDFTHSMDACFTYLVPDMKKKGFYLTISQNPDGTWEAVWKENKMGINKALIGNDKEPEMAVCKAFMEV